MPDLFKTAFKNVAEAVKDMATLDVITFKGKVKIEADTELDDFESLYIPGFHRTYQDSNIGVGWGYGLSYMIPITKKDRKQEVAN